MIYLVSITAKKTKWGYDSDFANSYVDAIQAHYELEWLKQTSYDSKGKCSVLVSTEDTIEKLYDTLDVERNKKIKRLYDKHYPNEKYDGSIDFNIIEVGKCMGSFGEDVDCFLGEKLIKI